MREEKRRKSKVVEKYDIYMDPDVEFMDELGMFEKDRKEYDRSITEKYVNVVRIILVVSLVLLVCLMSSCSRREPVVEETIVGGITVAEEIATMTGISVPHEYLEKQEAEEKARVEKAQEELIIDGYDYASYNRGEISMMSVMKELNYTEPTLLVSTYYKGVIATLTDGNIFTMHREYGNYSYYLFIPKGMEVEDVSVGGDFELNTISNYEYGTTFDVYAITCFLVKKGTNIEMPVNIKLADGTVKKLSVYITKEY